MKNFLTIGIAVLAMGLSIFGLVNHQKIEQSFGATSNAGANALFEQSLAQPLGTTDPNMYVTSGADVQGNLLPLNSYQCLSVDTGQPNFETICGDVTTSGTSGLTLAVTLRGLSTQTATTSNSSFIFTHRRGADVRITDFPTLTVNNNELNGVQSIPNPILYSSNFTTTYWATAASNTLVTLGQAAAIAQSGCGNASESVSGCSQLATNAQAAAGTNTGSTGSRLVPPNSLFNATPSSAIIIPVTSAAGKLAQGFWDLTQAYIWSGLHTFTAGFLATASSTLVATTSIQASNVLNNALILNKIPYAFPSTQGVANSSLVNNGSGILSWSTSVPKYTLSAASFATSNGYSTSTAITLPAGTLTASSTIQLTGNATCTSGTGVCTYYLRTSAGATITSCAPSITGSSNNTQFLNFTMVNVNAVNSQNTIKNCFSENNTPTNLILDFGNSTSAIDLSQAVGIVFVTQGTSNTSGTVNFDLVVNP